MTGTEQGDTTVEKFAPNGGTAIAVIGGLVCLGFIVGWAVDTDDVPPWVPALALFAAVVIYASTVRPRVLVEGRDLVLRNMLSTIRLPLASIEEIAVRQVMAVRAGGKRYVCAGVGRTLRQAMKGSAVQRARQEVGGLRGELAKTEGREPGMNYADFVEIRVQELVNEDLARRGIKKRSAEADALAEHVRREWAWPEIGALAVTTVLVVAGFLVG
ncbi:hypothetical protein [Nocardioides halotolerans]|uniref:hypothetical protein n=1 Tax=Nocardioides halotolerans TaxID=433660 RepID=UPI00040DE353|nr:hypothetical protein [Nocardioides halotolerans]